MQRLHRKILCVVFLCCLALFAGVGTAVGAQQDNSSQEDPNEVTTTDAFDRFDLTIDRPLIAGTKSTASVDIYVPDDLDVPGFDFSFVSSTLNVNLEVDNNQVDSDERTVNLGSNVSLSLSHTFPEAGIYDITINGQVTFRINRRFRDDITETVSGSITRKVSVLDPSLNFDIILVESPLEAGERADIETNLSLTGIPPGAGQSNLDADLLVDGTKVSTSSIQLSGNESTPVLLTHTFDSAGTYNLTITGGVTFPNIGVTLSRSITRTVSVADTAIDFGNIQLEGREISANFSVPDVPQRDVSGRVQATLFVDSNVRATQEVEINDGEQSTVRLAYTQPTAGTRNITIKLNGSVQGYDFSGSVTTELSVGKSISGVTFAVPDTLEDEANALSRQIDALPSNVSVLVSESNLYLVFASADLRTGSATVDGVVLDQQRSQSGFSFGVVLASNVTYADPRTATVSQIRSNPSSYRLDSVQVTDTYRRVSTLVDPDTVPLTVAQTTGVMGGPLHPLIGNIGARAARLVANVSNNTNSRYAEEVDSLFQRTGQSRLPTTGLTSGFWASAETQVTGLVISPGSRARDYLQTFAPGNNTYVTGGLPLLYRTSQSFKPTQVDNISSLSRRAGTLGGDVVSVTAKLYQGRLSLQETIEHGTTAQCPRAEETLSIQTQEGPICVNVPVDLLLHGGVAWNGVPTSRDDVLFIVGASSREQDRPFKTKRGTYEIVGTLRDTSEVSGLLPDGKILVAHDLERTGSFTLGEDARELARNRTQEILDTLRNQVNSTVSQLRSRLPVDIRDIVSEDLQEQRQVSASLDVPDIIPERNVTGTVQTRLVVDGESVATKQVAVTDGKTAKLNLTYTPRTTFGNTATLWVNGSVAGRTVSASVTVEFDVNEQFSGTSFVVPESLEDEVSQLRGQLQIPGRVPPNVSILANASDVHLVFSNTTPETGRANITGVGLNRTLNSRNLTFGVILARNATYSTTGRPVSVSEITSNPAEYRRNLVRVNATHRHAALLADPDTGTQPTVSGTAGVLTASPQPPGLLKSILSTARTVVLNGSVSQFDGSLNGSLTRALGEQSLSRLPTVSLQTDFWTDASATVDAVVLSPGSAARTFAERFDFTNSSTRTKGNPLLYRTQASLNPKQLDSISSLHSSSDSLSGEVVSVEANFSQQRISVQETLEHSTNETCSTDRLPIETPEGTTCVNIQFDTLAHGGVAWTTDAPMRDNIVPVIGLSSREQDTPQKRLVGTYRIVGEVVKASRLNASWPNEPLLVAYDLTRRNGLDLRNETQETVTNRVGEVVERVRDAINRTGNSLTPPRRTVINGTIITDQSTTTNITLIAVNASTGPSLNRPADDLASLVNRRNVITATTTTNSEFRLEVPDGRYRLVAFNPATGTVSAISNVPAGSTGLEITVSSTLERGLPPIAGDAAPDDTDGDGLYENIRGQDPLSLLDVQALFDNLDNPAVRNNTKAFKFSGVGTETNVLDVQSLFNEI